MARRVFFAFDNEALLIDGSSPRGNVGDPIRNDSNSPDGTIYRFQPGESRERIVIDDDGGSRNVLEDNREDDHEIIDGGSLVEEDAEVEAESILTLQRIDDQGDPVGEPFEIVIYSQDGQAGDVWGFGTDAYLVAGARYEKIGGTTQGRSVYAETFCLTSGTRIATPTGERPVEDLSRGDLVVTMDHGPQPVRALLSRRVGAAEMERMPRLAPVRIGPGALDGTLPLRPLVVSPQHRMLVRSRVAERMFGSGEVLIAARKLTALPGIDEMPADRSVTYWHVVLDRHAIIFAEGAPTETLFLGAQALTSIGPEGREELSTLFPGVISGSEAPAMARPIPSPRRQRRLAERIWRNRRPALERP